MKFYRQFITGDSLVFDVGANVGNKTEQFQRMARKVIAFEPVISCVEALLKRFHGNPKVYIVPSALGEECGEADMEMGDIPNLSTLAPDWKRAVRLTKRFGGFQWDRKQHVGITTLDFSIERFGIPDFIKIDVEGYEDKVMLGLSRKINSLCFEFTPEHLAPMIVSVERLMMLGEYEFNYSLGETLEMGLNEWVGPSEIIMEVERVGTDNVVYGDVYARLSRGRGEES